MGISGLLTCLSLKQTNISKLGIKKVAVDTSQWIYDSVEDYPEMVISEDIDVILRYCREFLVMLEANDVVPILVFDGISPPIRQEFRHKRAEARDEKYRKYKTTSNLMDLRGAFKITVALTSKLVKEFVLDGVECLVSIYEADAQMAHLANKGVVQAVITNDTDIIVFSVNGILFKLEKTGRCQEYSKALLYRKQKQNVSFEGFNDRMFRECCVLSGCDYVDSFRKIHIMCDLIRRHRSWTKVLDKHDCKKGYKMKVERALLAYQYYIVYDKAQRKMVYWNDVEEKDKACNMDFLGEMLDYETASGMAEGKIYPVSKKPFLKNCIEEGESAQAAKIDTVAEEEATIVETIDEGATSHEGSIEKRRRKKVKFTLLWRFRLLMWALYQRICRF